MREIDLRQLQEIELDILKAFADFCDRNGLSYYLDAGTLLGAVRHQGYIPWDNDVDVGMLRPEFDKLMVLLKECDYKIGEHYVVELPKDTMFTYIKIGDTRTELIEYPNTYPTPCYAYIDVFPKDGVQDRNWKGKMICTLSRALCLLHWRRTYTLPYWRTKKTGVKKWIANILSFCIGKKPFELTLQEKMIRRYGKKHPIDSCKYVTTMVIGEYDLCAPTEYFTELTELPFEGRMFKVPAGYRQWMEIKYGSDYMQLPPVEKRWVHDIICRWVDA